jgi:amino acid adenylation domain-containing protein
VNDRAQTSREYWRGKLMAGGSTAIPRWTREPVAKGMATHQTSLDPGLSAAVRRLAQSLDVPLSALLLAAHAKVLSALSGEREVITGHAALASGAPLPCALTTEPRSWQSLVLETRQREAELLRHRDFAVDELARELKLSAPAFETVFDAQREPRGQQAPGERMDAGAGTQAADSSLLRVSFRQQGDAIDLRLQYRTEAIDAEGAARIAGYHLRALALMAGDPLAEHARQSLLSEQERELQLHGMAGPRIELPNARFHQLFEQRVQAHPEAIAAECKGRQWSYRELNGRANQLARALMARGLSREGVVAVVTERNLDWMAAVIAILKAGGVYLPIEPHFPGDRIAATLARAGCTLVLTEQGSTGTLSKALASLADVRLLFVDAAYAQDHAQDDLGIDVGPDQLAYIYFTSGSTGEPKGAMCEHAGMVNHLYAKIEDLGVREAEVVAQTAPQCFDISLWQLVSALLVGGKTLIIEQEAILDVERFVDKIDRGRVGVLQLVPSYLTVVLAYLNRHPRELAHLHCVSVTGEALTMELTRSWFALYPRIKLANAYGLTETSDDTHHEVMNGVPPDGRVLLGAPVRNVRTYVVDEHLAPVPLGAPGEIVFSGVCVGRGYINDPERTRLAFMGDPHRPGERLYRTGDHGRWLPNGKLVYLGRRDNQVKIRGFRIEIGEIENTLLREPGISHAAVVIAGSGDADKRLVAFHAGDPFEAGVLRSRLAEFLPDYMVPSACHWQQELPLTANGKVDKKALKALAESLEEVGGNHLPPSTAPERRMAAAWAAVLGLPESQLSRHDHFFDRGGTSLSAVKLVIALERALSLRDVTRHPVLADMARLLADSGHPVARPRPVEAAQAALDAAARAPAATRSN